MGMRRSNYQWVCKVPGCGQPRYEDCTNALCETHYLEYMRAASKRTWQRRKHGELNEGMGRPPKSAS